MELKARICPDGNIYIIKNDDKNNRATAKL